MSAASRDEQPRVLGSGRAYKAALEERLLALPEQEADELMQLLKEGRGAWQLFLSSTGGAALFLGDPRSGTLVALARAGFAVTACHIDQELLQLALERDRALAAGELRTRALTPGEGLPFEDEAFQLVVCEGALPAASPEEELTLAELRRVCAGELALVADNRLGYKRSSGRRADFRVPGPLEWLGAALCPRDGRKSFHAYKRDLARARLERPRSFALYPHSRDFSQIAALDSPRPALAIGPKERANRIKLAGRRLGLFPLFTPSFLFLTRRPGAQGGPRVDRLLSALAERLGEQVPELEHCIATRGNTAVLLTCAPGTSSSEPSGRWCVHVPLSPQQEVQARNHLARLRALRDRSPGLPLPEPLFAGELEGLFVTCERRLGGLSLAQLPNDPALLARVYSELARALADLVVERVRVDDGVLQELVGAKTELVQRHAGELRTRAALEKLGREAERALLGCELPRVVYHADLRPKHVQASPDGELLGLLDWGSSESSDLPYFDLLHLIVHQRKQEADLTAGAAWRLVRSGRELRPYEREALEEYALRISLDPKVARALESLYPILVGAMAEKNWDYSRPRWVQRNFELGP